MARSSKKPNLKSASKAEKTKSKPSALEKLFRNIVVKQVSQEVDYGAYACGTTGGTTDPYCCTGGSHLTMSNHRLCC
jgi:hypothetical protein